MALFQTLLMGKWVQNALLVRAKNVRCALALQAEHSGHNKNYKDNHDLVRYMYASTAQTLDTEVY